MTTKESRRDPRSRALNLTVRYKSATVADFVEDHSYDISRGGLFIKTSSPFATGTLLKFEVRIVGEKTVIDGVGRVAWRREKNLGPGKPAGMGIKFIRIDDTCVQLIEQAVSRHETTDNQFEEGAREQGVMLSEPPANLRGETPQPQNTRPQNTQPAAVDAESEPPRAPMFPAHRASDVTPEDASEQSMLFQTSELLKSALNKVNPEASIEANIKQPEIRTTERHDYDDVTAEDRATLPTGSSKIPPPAVRVVATSKKVEVLEHDEDEEDVDDDGPDSSDTDETTSEPPPAAGDNTADDNTADDNTADDNAVDDNTGARRSKRPGTNKRKNPKKKKRKFNYASLPAPKQNKSALSTTPPADKSSSTSPAKHRSEFPGAAPAPTPSTTNSFWWIATLALVAISGALYLAFSSPEPTVVRPDVAVSTSPRAEASSAVTPVEALPSSAQPNTLAVATTVATGPSSDSASSTTESNSSSDSSGFTSSSDTGDPLAAATELEASEPAATADEAGEEETPARPTRRSRRRVKPVVEPESVAPLPPPVVAPTAPSVVAPQAPSAPVVPAPQAPPSPQAPAVVTPQAPVAPAPVTPQVPVPTPAPAPSSLPAPPAVIPPVSPVATQVPQARQAPQTPAPTAPATAPKTPTPAPAPVPQAPLPQGKPVVPPPARVP